MSTHELMSNETTSGKGGAEKWNGPVGGGEMGQLLRDFDWSKTSLGPLRNWPDTLRHAVNLCLSCRFPMHIWWGEELIYLYNDPQIPVLGKRHPAALGQPAAQTWKDIWPLLKPQMEDVILRGQSTWNDRVHVVTDRNGFPEDTWFTWSYCPIRDTSGEIRGLFAVAIEETSRVLAELERDRLTDESHKRGTEKLARDILESITDGFFALDREWRFSFVNPQGEKILERQPGDLIGQSIWEVYPGLDESEFGLSYRRCARERTAVSFTAFYPAHQRWYEAHAYPSDAGISVYFQDVTARIAMAQTLEHTRLRLNAALDAGKITTWIWDLASNRILSDSKVSALFNLAPHREEGYPLSVYTDALHPEDKVRVTALLERAVMTGEDYEAEYRVSTFDPPHWIFARARAEKDAAGKVTRLTGVAIDISDRKRLEEERERLLESERLARSEAERAGRMKDEFLATLSHELRTPLNAVLGWCEVLKMGAKDQADLDEGLLTIERNARAQAQIIADMLDMSRIMSGKVRLDVQRVDLGVLLREAIETVKPAADGKGIRVQPVLDSSTAPVSGDPNRLQQIVWNLLSNAVKFTPKGGRIQVLLERINSHLEISVSDNGEGITPDFLPYVFDRFRQADSSTTRRHGGLGLGLSIVKNLVELHGGSIHAKSAGEGLGSTFTVKLPLLILQPETESGESRRYAHVGNSTSLESTLRDKIKGTTVLVVDDEPDARNLLKRLLTDCGAKVITAGSASEAIEEMSRQNPDVIVSDIGMPQEDGFSFIRRVRSLELRQGRNTPAVALTAYARSEDRTRSIIAGFQMHIPKPVEPAELIAVVASLAGLKLE